jgi:hypothetical protein
MRETGFVENWIAIVKQTARSLKNVDIIYQKNTRGIRK